MESTQATMDVLNLFLSHFSAIAPAATREDVSRALALPPPLDERTPYFF